MKEYLSEEELDALEFKLLVEWLQTVPTTEWHVMAQEWNYDNADDILHWLVDNPRTENATALMIYWMSGARFMKQFASAEDARRKSNHLGKNWEFTHKLESKYLADFYTVGTVGFDPANDNSPGSPGYDWTPNYKDLPAVLPVPSQMLQAVPGIYPASTQAYIEGIPEHIWDQLDLLRGDDDEEDEDE